MKIKSRQQIDRWMLLTIALLLFVVGVNEYPHALKKMQRTADTWHFFRSTASMMLAAGLAFWIGCRAPWLIRLEKIQPRYWSVAALTLAVSRQTTS